MNLTYLPALLLVNTAVGCAIPFPHTTEWAPELSGQVMDAETGEPVEGVCLRYVWTNGVEDDGPIEVSAKSDALGHFVLPALKQSHWGYMFSIALNYSLPYPKWGREAWVLAEHSGYEVLEFQVDPETVEPAHPDGLHVVLNPIP